VKDVNANPLSAGLVIAVFAVELVLLLRRANDPWAIFVLLATLHSVVVGEWINLTVTQVTSYPGCAGFPLYIVCGGGLVGLWLFRSARGLARTVKRDAMPFRLGFALLLSGLFPLLEMAGITLGLWTWDRPCNFLSPGWLIGVWFFYGLFLGTPAMLALTIDVIWGSVPEKKS
jgi:hypothetical protein